MASVVDKIREWAQTLPLWERAALDKIAAGIDITDADCQEILDYLLRENSLASLKKPLPELKLDQWSPGNTETKVNLVSISELQGVNALVPDQKITFGSSLTAIYGENGSGKSGYARVLGCAGFTRGDVHILPDYNTRPDECVPASASIEVDDGNCVRTICFSQNACSPELRSIHVFDSTSVTALFAKPHGFSFTPAALSCLPKLVEVTDKVRVLLDEKIAECRQPRDFTRLFVGESDVVTSIRGLGVDSNIMHLESLANITPEDTKNREALERRKAELILKNTNKQIAELQRVVQDLNTLADKLKTVEVVLSDSDATTITQDVAECLRLQKIAHSEGVDQLVTEGLSKVGSEEWQAFALQAKTLAEAESEGREPYPHAGDICLLCHQPLNADACDLIGKLWAYLKGEARTALATADSKLKKHCQTMESFDVLFFGEQSVSRRHLESRDKTLVSSIQAFVESAVSLRDMMLAALKSPQVIKLTPLASSVSAALATVIKLQEYELGLLRNENTSAELEKVENQLRLLQHRDVLRKNLDNIKDYIGGLRWAKNAESCRGSTRHITIKHNELFHELVTKEYVDLFVKILAKLDCPMTIGIATRSEKGKVLKNITLKVDNDNTSSIPSPDKILSEGEKRAVALSDFLTEVALDECSCGIVIDDPVTSLDHRWKEMMAKCLVSEARLQQVIIFTHDLHFLWMLNEHASKTNIDIKIHWIKRGDDDDRPGYVYLDNCPGLEQKYKTAKISREFLEEAKNAQPQKQEYLLKQGFGALRTTYEAFVIHDLFRGVVGRWEERISLENRLDKILLDDQIVSTVVQKHGDISRYIEGHSHTDTALKPSIKTLAAEIEAFDNLRTRHKELLKAAGKN